MSIKSLQGCIHCHARCTYVLDCNRGTNKPSDDDDDDDDEWRMTSPNLSAASCDLDLDL